MVEYRVAHLDELEQVGYRSQLGRVRDAVGIRASGSARGRPRSGRPARQHAEDQEATTRSCTSWCEGGPGSRSATTPSTRPGDDRLRATRARVPAGGRPRRGGGHDRPRDRRDRRAAVRGRRLARALRPVYDLYQAGDYEGGSPTAARRSRRTRNTAGRCTTSPAWRASPGTRRTPSGT